MRVVITGTNAIAIATAKRFIEESCEVIIIEANEEDIDTYSEELDCNFIHGDATNPHILKETDPRSTDMLLCLTDHDQNNIISALVGKSMGFENVIINVTDSQWQTICSELGLKNTVLSARIISKHLKELGKGKNIFELADLLKNKLRMFSFKANKATAKEVQKIKLPKNSKIVWLYRKDNFLLVDNQTKIKPGDEVVIASSEESIKKLSKLFNATNK